MWKCPLFSIIFIILLNVWHVLRGNCEYSFGMFSLTSIHQQQLTANATRNTIYSFRPFDCIYLKCFCSHFFFFNFISARRSWIISGCRIPIRYSNFSSYASHFLSARSHSVRFLLRRKCIRIYSAEKSEREWERMKSKRVLSSMSWVSFNFAHLFAAATAAANSIQIFYAPHCNSFSKIPNAKNWPKRKTSSHTNYSHTCI